MKSLHNVFSRVALALALLALVSLVAPTSDALAQSAKSYFIVGHSEFHALLKDAKKRKYRTSWEKVERSFTSCLKADPNGSYAPKALYYIGRVNEELGKQSGLKSDFRTAADYFGRVVARYPRHGWADDCLYRRADIYAQRLGEKDNARQDLARIITEFPKSDMQSKARAYLKQLGKYDQSIAAVSGGAPEVSTPDDSIADDTATDDATLDDAAEAAASESIEPSDPSGRSHLNMVRYRSSDDYTRVVLELDGKAKYRYQVLGPNPAVNRPHRLYIDITGAELGNDVTRNTDVADGILRSIRTGQHDRDTTRVVLDFLSMQEYKIFPLENPYRIVIDVYGPDENTPKVAAAEPEPQKSSKPSKSTKPSKATDYRPPKGAKSKAGDLLEQLGLTVQTIMIDAGHGGKDPGAVSNGLREKDINLRFAKILGSLLKEKGFNIHYTREDDTFIRLEQRTAMANVKKADLFISVHCNANRTRSVNGLETYSLNLAKTDAAVRIAARENAVDPRSISDLQFILTDLMVNSKIKESGDLASDVQLSTVNRVRQKWEVKSQGTREAPFYVLMGAKMPSILVEIGYITNPTEAKRINSDEYLRYLARGIVDGVMAYKSKIERYASL